MPLFSCLCKSQFFPSSVFLGLSRFWNGVPWVLYGLLAGVWIWMVCFLYFDLVGFELVLDLFLSV